MNKVPFYFPLANGRYEVRPGLYSLGENFENNPLDQFIFQIDSKYPEYIQDKRRTLKESHQKYFCTDNPSLQSLVQISVYIARQLCLEYPEYFKLEENLDHIILHCNALTSQKQQDIYLPVSAKNTDLNQIKAVINNLMLQVQEDLAIIELKKDGQDFISLLHLSYPNHWSAEEKIGSSFIEAHSPVPNMESINNRSQQLLSALIHKGPYVRFAWGLSTDQKLNHHQTDNDMKAISQGREFISADPALFLRVERQITVGFPEEYCFLFTIRTYHYNVADLKKNSMYCDALVSAVSSMSDETLKYKGLINDREEILKWLNQH